MAEGPVARTIAIPLSLGTSELFQKKPFQDIGSADRPTGRASSLLRFLPVGAGAIPSAVLDPLFPNLPEPPKGAGAATSEDRAVQEAVAEASRRRQRARGFRSTILRQEYLAPGQPQRQQTLGS